jgi:phthalate 4,5-cis-dihydrodiol dehydrogenase
MARRVLKAGVAGLGLGAARIVYEMEASPDIELYAAADNNPDQLAHFHRVFPEARTSDSLERLAADPEVEAVWLATPNELHAEHAVTLANAGKAVMVQKPMCLSIQEAEAMCEAADRNNVKLLVGHSQAYSNWVRLARQIVRSGELGKLGAINVFASNGWLFGTRKLSDLDPALGGGITMRNAAHQIDCIRLIGGGMLKSIRGSEGNWMPERPYPGYYAAYMEFVDGVSATAIQNAYGYFSADELIPTGSTPDEIASKVASRGAVRRAFQNGTRNEAARYAEQGIGRPRDFGASALDPEGGWMGAWYAADSGIILISCERGDIRQSPNGVYVYDEQGAHEIRIAHGASPSTWYLQLQEMYNAVALGHKAHHSGRWGMATMEAVFGLVESGRTRREVQLTHQIEMDEDYDRDYFIPREEVVPLDG